MDKLDQEASSDLVIDKVLLFANGENVIVGQPYLKNVKITAKVIGDMKGDKVRGIKFGKRKRRERTIGHRQNYSYDPDQRAFAQLTGSLVTVTFHNLSYDEELRLPDTDDRIVSITIEGHAIPGEMFGDVVDEKKAPAAKGENIICAAVSFSGLNLIRSLTIIAGANPDYSVENGYMKVSLATGSHGRASKIDRRGVA